MPKVKKLARCDRTDCFANDKKKCEILTRSEFGRRECPFYKHHSKVDKAAIEAEILAYSDHKAYKTQKEKDTTRDWME